MKLLRSIICIVLVAGIAVGGYFAYRSCATTENTPKTATVQTHKATSGNPYEDPNDPNTEENGTVFSVETMTGYFLELNLKGLTNKISQATGEYLAKHGALKSTKRSVQSFTFIITFMDMTYNDKPILITTEGTLEVPSRWGSWYGNRKVVFQNSYTESDDTAIRLPSAYYNFFQYEIQNSGKTLRNFKVVLFWNGDKSCSLADIVTCDYRLYTKDIPADSDDPTSPNFNLGSWAGLSAIINKTGCNLPYMAWIGYAVLVVIILLFAMIIIKIIRWGLGKS